MDSEGEEMMVVKFQWFFRGFCCDLPSLKMAAKFHAVEGIILSSLILVLGAGANFLMARLVSDPRYGLISSVEYGVIFIVIGTLLLIYNIFLLRRVKDNRAASVYKIIKIGCLLSLYIELITEFVYLLLHLFLHWLHPSLYRILLNSLFFLLNVLVIYGIHGVRPKIVSAYIYIKTILFALAIPLIWFGIWYFAFYLMIIPCIFIMVFMDYYLRLFALQINMMSIGPVSNDHHKLYINT